MNKPQKNTLLETTLGNVFKLLDDDPQQLKKPSEITNSKLEQNILMTIRRHQASILWLIKTYASGKVRPRTRKVLCFALAELLFLNGAPMHAVVDAATSYVKKHHAPQEASFVNAFLRTITAKILENTTDIFQNAPETIRLEMPDCLWKRWIAEYGIDATREIAQNILDQGKTIFRLQTFPPVTSGLPDILEPLSLPDLDTKAQFFKLKKRLPSLTSFMQEHPQFYIQDPATMLAVFLLNPRPGETVADLCAAPGGKARLIAEAIQNTGRLIAADKADSKLETLKQNLRQFSCVTVIQQDAAQPTLPKQSLDAILLDVPCSNTGVLKRKPDAKWSFSKEKLQELTQIQSSILEAAVPLLKQTGRLVYSTCSLEPEENRLQVEAFLKRHADFRCASSRQLLPTSDHDGAYAALLERN